MKLSHVEGAVLAGGAASRTGRDKATLEIGGHPMVERVAEALSSVVSRVRIVLRPEQANPTRLERIDDGLPARAPLVGVAAALRACEVASMCVCACDLPDLDPRVLLALLACVPDDDGPDVVALLGPRGPEALIAVYHRRLLPEIDARIARGEFRMQALIEGADSVLIPERVLRELDPDLHTLRNVNRPEDGA